MKVMFSAGEASGDLHASRVAAALKELNPSVSMFGMGGQAMKAAGVDIVYDIEKLGYIGIVEIVKALPKFFALRKYLRNYMIEEKPDVLVCVDYPGFNMKLAKVAKELGIPVLYYIAPTIWAWHKSRGNDIRKTVARVASIFPFEAKAYEEMGCPVTFVGHPLLDIVKASMTEAEAEAFVGAKEGETRILLMPGSRLQEVKGLLPTMLASMVKVKEQHPNLHCYLPRASTIDKNLLASLCENYDVPVTIFEGNTYDVMSLCDLAVAASGTATLETALMGLPTILVYRVADFTYFLAKRLVQTPYVGLPNIIAGKAIIPELLQEQVNVPRLSKQVEDLLQNTDAIRVMKEDFITMKEALGEPGAVKRVAQLIIDLGTEETP